MEQKNWHQLSGDELLESFGVTREQGLTEEDTERRRQESGWNELLEGARISPFILFLNQFKDFMMLVLMGATLISGLLGEYLDAVTIIAIVILNGVLGFVQEFRAERSLRALKQLSAPHANVLRQGKIQNVTARELVPGDIVIMESGDRIPADIRWIVTNSLDVEESALTGESHPVGKHTKALYELEVPLGDQKNMGFMGTMITRGSGKGIVVRSGMDTEMGKIADLLQNTETQDTPLQRRLAQLGKILIYLSLALTVLVVLVGIINGQPAGSMFLAGVSLAVAAIPEGLPAIVTIALALGVQRMIKRKAIVRKLPSVETLGCASVICSDKTGTLTQNKMTVTKLWLEGRSLEVTGEGYEPVGNILDQGLPVDLKRDQTLRRLLQISSLCGNAVIFEEDTGEEGRPRRKGKEDAAESQWRLKGDPTEGALVVLSSKMGLSPTSLGSMYTREVEFPFDSKRKRMSVVVSHQGGKIVLVKGAPDMLLEQCSYILWGEKLFPLRVRSDKRS